MAKPIIANPKAKLLETRSNNEDEAQTITKEGMPTAKQKYWKRIPEMGMKYQGKIYCCQTESQNIHTYQNTHKANKYNMN